ncbi:MAG: SpoIIE family protein phosphatase [Planctomycetaceae bacterium]|jgi:serine phosphatase RsbU (regulator of sigma subunit)/pSer/pThr/pTyr-binding forkhead associated (FHA) protein|nr:SpoIIE family protein phosphatase [Planctomycetaceae bacterium]
MARLHARKNSILKDADFPLLFDTTVLGRHPYCEVILEHGAVSREHAKISREKGRYYIEDLHSRNGTWLNQKQVERKQPLFNGDVIRICDLEFIFHDDSAVRPPTASDSRIDTGHEILFDETSPESLHITSQIPVKLLAEKGTGNYSKAENYGDAPTLSPKSSHEQRFRALIDLGRDIGFQNEESLSRLAKRLLKFFLAADRVYIFLRDEITTRFVLHAFQHRDPSLVNEKLRISRSTLEKAASQKVAILSDDVSEDSWFGENQTLLDSRICSIMVTPLLDSRQNVFGVIQLDSHSTGKRFNSNDLDTLVSIAYHVSITYENIQRYEAMAQERELEREMSVAHKVQKGFLPIQPPKVENYGFFDYYQPAKYLGGDYFDYIALPDGRLAVALGDVSGKGVSAALLMAKLSSEVRYSLVTEPTPADAMKRLNNIFCEVRWDNRFITFLLTLIDPKTHVVTMLNAGHNPPLLCDICVAPELAIPDRPHVREIADNLKGLPLGVQPDAMYNQLTFELSQGQMIAIFSDGLTDAMNMEGQPFDLSRIKEFLSSQTRQQSVDAIGRRLIDAIRAFSGNAPQSDDQCLVLFGRF